MIVTRDFEISLVAHLVRDEAFFKQATYVTPLDFELAPCRLIFETARDYFTKFGSLPTMDILVTHIFYMMSRPESTQLIPEERPMLAAIMEMVDKMALDTKYYSHHLEEYMKATRTRKMLAKHVESIQRGLPPDDMLAEMAKINAGIKPRSKYKRQVIDENPALIISQTDRIVVPTGLWKLDWAMAGGLGLKTLGMITACPGIGKTTSLINFMVYAIENNARCLFLTLEQTADEITFRYQAIRGMVEAAHFKKMLKEWPEDQLWRFSRIQNPEVRGYGYSTITDMSESKPTVDDIENEIIGWKEDTVAAGRDVGTCRLVLIDWLDYIQPRKGTYGKRDERPDVVLTGVTEQLAELSRRHNVAIWTATQGNKGAVKKEILNMDDVAGAFHKNDALTVSLGLGVIGESSVNIATDDMLIDPPCKRTLKFNFMKNRNNPKINFEFYQGSSLRYYDNEQKERERLTELEKGYDKIKAVPA